MAASQKKHPFHLVDPSPWPFIGSLAALLTVLGTILYVRQQSALLLLAGLALLILTTIGWFRDIILEAKTQHTTEVRVGFRYGMALFIASEVMFFVAFFWAYFNSALMPTEQIGMIWPPKGVRTIPAFELPYFNTLLLLLSGTTITWAHHSLLEGKIKDFLDKTLITVLLGFLFLGVQVFEYIHAPFAFKGGIYPSTFFMATGFHGAHVCIGALFLLVCWFRGRAGHFTPKDHFGFEAAAWYWHFVDVVWLFLFVSIYWWGSSW